MATLEKIRNRAGLLVAVVGLALFAFIIGDLLNSSSSLRNKGLNNVLVVNGNAVEYQEYMIRENEMIERYKLELGSSNLNENYLSQIRQGVFEEFVMENILDPRLDDLGITVTSQEMTDMVEGEFVSPLLMQNRMFVNPETGMFDRYALNMFLNRIKNIEGFPEEYQSQIMQQKMMWMFWEKDIKRYRMNEKYTTLLSKAVTANSLDAKDAFDNSIISSDIVYVMGSFTSISDSLITITNAEIEKLYNERKEMFRQQETSVIDYIAVDIVPSQADFEQASKDMDAVLTELKTTDNVAALTNEKSERKYMNVYYSISSVEEDQDLVDFFTTASVGDITGPSFKDNQYRIMQLVDKTEYADSVNVSIITLMPRATEAETKAFADSLLNVIKGGANFTELVQQFSGDQMRQADGVIGWMTEAGALEMVGEEFKQTVFSLSPEQSAIVKSTFGTHIVKVTERTKPVSKYKVADIVYTVSPSSASRSQLYNDLNQFIAQNNSIEKIEAAVKDAGYSLTTNVKVLTTDAVVGSISNARQVVRWAFNSKKGQISDILECDNKFVVATHKGKMPEGYQSIADVTPQLKDELMLTKKGELIAANLKKRNLSSIEDYAIELNTIPDTVRFVTMSTPQIANIGVEPKLNAFITYSPLNQISEPVVGNNGVYVFQVINRTNDQHLYVKENQISMLESNNTYRLRGLVFRYMQQNAKIQDNRIRFF